MKLHIIIASLILLSLTIHVVLGKRYADPAKVCLGQGHISKNRKTGKCPAEPPNFMLIGECCVKCKICPAGYEKDRDYANKCIGNCDPCPQNPPRYMFSNEATGTERCSQCKYCDLMNRFQEKNCTSTQNSECGYCKPGYVPTTYSDNSHSTCHKNRYSKPQIFTKPQQNLHATTKLHDNTDMVTGVTKLDDSNKNYNITPEHGYGKSKWTDKEVLFIAVLCLISGFLIIILFVKRKSWWFKLKKRFQGEDHKDVNKKREEEGLISDSKMDRGSSDTAVCSINMGTDGNADHVKIGENLSYASSGSIANLKALPPSHVGVNENCGVGANNLDNREQVNFINPLAPNGNIQPPIAQHGNLLQPHALNIQQPNQHVALVHQPQQQHDHAEENLPIQEANIAQGGAGNLCETRITSVAREENEESIQSEDMEVFGAIAEPCSDGKNNHLYSQPVSGCRQRMRHQSHSQDGCQRQECGRKRHKSAQSWSEICDEDYSSVLKKIDSRGEVNTTESQQAMFKKPTFDRQRSLPNEKESYKFNNSSQQFAKYISKLTEGKRISADQNEENCVWLNGVYGTTKLNKVPYELKSAIINAIDADIEFPIQGKKEFAMACNLSPAVAERKMDGYALFSILEEQDQTFSTVVSAFHAIERYKVITNMVEVAKEVLERSN